MANLYNHTPNEVFAFLHSCILSSKEKKEYWIKRKREIDGDDGGMTNGTCFLKGAISYSLPFIGPTAWSRACLATMVFPEVDPISFLCVHVTEWGVLF